MAVETRNPSPVHPYAFEVLDESYEVVPPGAALRVCPRFMFRWVTVMFFRLRPVLMSEIYP